LYDPEKGIGNANTWLLGTQGAGYFRTEDAGQTWKKVSDSGIAHGQVVFQTGMSQRNLSSQGNVASLRVEINAHPRFPPMARGFDLVHEHES
jgi:hypothetical protein